MEEKKLHIVWANADPVSSEFMVMMYAKNAMKNNWWDAVTIVIWGKPSQLICENAQLQLKMRELEAEGVKFSACLTCADELGTTEKLKELGIEVIRWGKLLTDLLQNNEKVIIV